MPETTCTACGRAFDTDASTHYRRVEPGASATTILYFCSAACVGENAGLFDE